MFNKMFLGKPSQEIMNEINNHSYFTFSNGKEIKTEEKNITQQFVRSLSSDDLDYHNIQDVVVGNNISSVKNNSFQSVTSLQSAFIPSKYNYGSFYGCSSLSSYSTGETYTDSEGIVYDTIRTPILQAWWYQTKINHNLHFPDTTIISAFGTKSWNSAFTSISSEYVSMPHLTAWARTDAQWATFEGTKQIKKVYIPEVVMLPQWFLRDIQISKNVIIIDFRGRQNEELPTYKPRSGGTISDFTRYVYGTVKFLVDDDKYDAWASHETWKQLFEGSFSNVKYVLVKASEYDPETAYIYE